MAIDAAQKFREWRESPTRMVRELFGVNPDPWQVEVLERFPREQRIAMIASKGVGKTSVLAWLGWNFLLTRPVPKCAATSISGDNLRDNLWTEMAKWRAGCPLLEHMFEWTSKRIFAKENPEQWWMSARTWPQNGDATQQAETLAGLHADYMLFLIDESGGMTDAIMGSAEAALSSCKEGHIVQAGNTTQLGGPLYRAWRNEQGIWWPIIINGDPDNPMRSPRVNLEWARQLIAEYGRGHPFVKVNLLGLFPDSNVNSLIGPEEVRAAMKRYYRAFEIEYDAKVIGIDVAREGDDQSVIAKRQGRQVFPFKTYRNLSGPQGAAIVNAEWSEWLPDGVFIDDTGGFGASWIDQLALRGRRPVGVHFSSSASDKMRFENKRAEMYMRAVEWIRSGGALPEDEDLLNDLVNTTYTADKGALILEPKKLVKKKQAGRSPDKADAFCFVAGTVVATPKGEAAIETLQIGDEVLTPFGVSCVRQVWASMTEAVTTAQFSNGARIQGTPSHEIFIYDHGRVRLDAITLTMVASPLSERRKWKSLSALFTTARSTGFKKAASILAPGSQSSVSAFCIGAFGLSIKVKFRGATKFIISTAAGGIPLSRTLSYSHAPSTALYISRITAPSAYVWLRTAILTAYDLLRRRGTLQQRGANGMPSTEGHLGPGGCLGLSPAVDVGNRTKQGTEGLRCFALARAHKLLGFIGIKHCRVFASGARRLLSRAGIGRRNVVPVRVTTEEWAPVEVFNITLEQDNAYYANGILVFNCLTFAEPVTRGSGQAARGGRHVYEWDAYATPVDNRRTPDYNPYDRGGFP